MMEPTLISTYDGHGLHKIEYIPFEERMFVICDGPDSIYVPGYLNEVFEGIDYAEVSPVPDEEKTDVRNEVWKYKTAAKRVEFENDVYLI